MVIERHRRSILKLTLLLRVLEVQQDNYSLLGRLQRALVVRIRQTEKDLAVLKAQVAAITQYRRSERPPRELSDALKEVISDLKETLDETKRMTHYWRCFGDGIAFLYIDKFALKHMFYKVENYAVKEPPGHLSDKDGFRSEWRVLMQLLEDDIPAVLCDLTNTLRHGDVCVLVGPDPYPIEVKSSQNTNARVDRQIENNAALLSFYRTDEAKNFRGVKAVRRIETPIAKTLEDAINQCLRESVATGYAAVRPEPGLVYICLRTLDTARLSADLSPRMMLCLLNEAKTEGSWAPFYPFVLSIRHPDDLFDFLQGTITLAVAIDTDAYVKVFKEHGLEAVFIEHPQAIVRVRRLDSAPEEHTALITIQMFSRHFHEFVSLASAAEGEARFIEHMEKDGSELAEKLKAGQLDLSDLDLVQLPLNLKLLDIPPAPQS